MKSYRISKRNWLRDLSIKILHSIHVSILSCFQSVFAFVRLCRAFAFYLLFFFVLDISFDVARSDDCREKHFFTNNYFLWFETTSRIVCKFLCTFNKKIIYFFRNQNHEKRPWIIITKIPLNQKCLTTNASATELAPVIIPAHRRQQHPWLAVDPALFLSFFVNLMIVLLIWAYKMMQWENVDTRGHNRDGKHKITTGHERYLICKFYAYTLSLRRVRVKLASFLWQVYKWPAQT